MQKYINYSHCKINLTTIPKESEKIRIKEYVKILAAKYKS